MSNVDAPPELLAAALSSAPPLAEVDVEVNVVVLPELLEECATEVTPLNENASELSLPQPSPRAAARARRRITPKGSDAFFAWEPLGRAGLGLVRTCP
ncbi:hypothetical protein [Nannocystis pusilla]|uniref:hypothetical protein n=1 Tax=Nannocystis pusilla TaxID=889268 RepID=UPI003DA4E7C7